MEEEGYVLSEAGLRWAIMLRDHPERWLMCPKCHAMFPCHPKSWRLRWSYNVLRFEDHSPSEQESLKKGLCPDCNISMVPFKMPERGGEK